MLEQVQRKRASAGIPELEFLYPDVVRVPLSSQGPGLNRKRDMGLQDDGEKGCMTGMHTSSPFARQTRFTDLTRVAPAAQRDERESAMHAGFPFLWLI